MIPFLDALADFLFPPPTHIYREPPRYAAPAVVQPVLPTPEPTPTYQPELAPPTYKWGVVTFKLGTWPSKAMADHEASQLRWMTIQRTPNGPGGWPWANIIISLQDHGGWTVLVFRVDPEAGKQFCQWLSTDFYAESGNDDLARPPTWPAWVNGKSKRTCQEHHGWW